MSRGLRPAQWQALKVLQENEETQGLPVRKLKDQMGRDPSNARRSVRGLLRRNFIEEVVVNDERRLRLTLWGRLRVAYPLPKTRRSLRAQLRAEDRERRREVAEELARREAEAAKGPWWFRYQHHFARRRLPGPAQNRILAVLFEYANPPDEGLAVPAVKAIVGGDRANTRRAIRTLLLRGEIEVSEDGQHIRLASGTALLFSIVPPIPREPIDEERARAILRAHQGSQVVT